MSDKANQPATSTDPVDDELDPDQIEPDPTIDWLGESDDDDSDAANPKES